MDILILDSWLRDFVDTQATPDQIAEKVSLCGPSIEKVEKLENDYLYHIEITANRPDTMGVYGIAREVVTILNRFDIPAQLKPLPTAQISSPSQSLPLTVEVDYKLTPRITGIVVDNVNIQPSPQIIQDRLKAVDIRSVNNIIDLTNYIMIETGQPMHAFDYDRLIDHSMHIGLAKPGEEFIDLHDIPHTLTGDEIVIRNPQGTVIDLPGVTGAANSAITDQTKRVLLFLDQNDPVRIRKASMRHNLRTVAATFNEKRPDPEQHLQVLGRSIELLKQLDPQASIASHLYDFYQQPYQPHTIQLTHDWLQTFIGVDLDSKQVTSILETLGFGVEYQSNQYTVMVPSHRAIDVTTRQDIAEEVARIFGYFQIPSVVPPLGGKTITQLHLDNPFQGLLDIESQIKHQLQALGYTELYSYSMYSTETISQFNLKTNDHIEILNPLTEDQQYMRTTLTPSLILALRDAPTAPTGKFFEIANTYHPHSDQPAQEIPMLTAVHLSHEPEYPELKGTVEQLLSRLNIQATFTRVTNHPYLSSNSANITVGDNLMGVIGLLKPEIAKALELKHPATILQLDLQVLLPLTQLVTIYKEIPQHPALIQDITFELPEKTEILPIIQHISQTNELIYQVQRTDTFQNAHTFRVYFQHPDRSLTDAEVQPIRQQIIDSVTSTFSAKVKA